MGDPVEPEVLEDNEKRRVLHAKEIKKEEVKLGIPIKKGI